MKLLVSWIGLNKDFVAGAVSNHGPNYLLHAQSAYDFDKHIILYNKEDYYLQARLFQQKIKKEFKTHQVELLEISMNDERDLNEVQNKVGIFLRTLVEDEVTLLLSTGTSIFKVTWYIFASSLQQNIKLIQYRVNHGDFGSVNLQRTAEPYSLMSNEQSLIERKNPASIGNFFEAPFLEPLYDRALKIAIVENTVLITGDTGTGKEHLAQFIHRHSARKSNRFVALNCAALNDDILLSELFGHVKGSFTGAVTDRVGIFEQAKGGVVFLDEIGDISPFMQQSLLRVLQERKIQRSGGAGKDIAVDVRIIAATNKNLLQKVADGTFREDLYYRLAVNELEVPSLEEWPSDDKRKLIVFFVDKKAKDLKVKPLKISSAALDYLLNYRFPGNIRELEGVIAGLYPFRTETPIVIADFPRRMRDDPSKTLSWEAIESEHIKRILMITKGNQNEASRRIGYSLNTLKSRLKTYKIDIRNYR